MIAKLLTFSDDALARGEHAALAGAGLLFAFMLAGFAAWAAQYGAAAGQHVAQAAGPVAALGLLAGLGWAGICAMRALTR